MIEKPLYEIQFRVKKEQFTKEFGWAYKISCILTILSFFIMVVLYMNSPEFPVAILDIKVEQPEFEVTSLAITSIIMILYNFFAWVNFEQDINKSTKFNNVRDEIDRARLLMSELDEVSAFCSTVKQLMTSKGKLHEDKDNKQGTMQNYVGSYVKLIKLSDNSQLNAKLRLKSQKKDVD